MFAAVVARLNTFAFSGNIAPGRNYSFEVCLEILKCCCCGHHVNNYTANSPVIISFDSPATDYLVLTSAD